MTRIRSEKSVRQSGGEEAVQRMRKVGIEFWCPKLLRFAQAPFVNFNQRSNFRNNKKYIEIHVLIWQFDHLLEASFVLVLGQPASASRIPHSTIKQIFGVPPPTPQRQRLFLGNQPI